MVGLCKQHKLKVLAEQAKKQQSEPLESAKSDSTSIVVDAALDSDLDALKGIKDIAEKASFKATLVDKYKAQVDDYIASGAQTINNLLVFMVMWLIDTGRCDTAIGYAKTAIAQNQPMPKNIKRLITDFVVEEIAEWALKQVKQKHSANPAIDDVIALVESGEWIVDSPIILGKLYRHAGMMYENFEEPKRALELYEIAMQHNDQAGCKGRISAIKKQLGID